jgi:tubulin alpha
VFIDTDPTAIDEVGPERTASCSIRSRSSPANSYAHDHYRVRKDVIDLMIDRIRKLADHFAGIYAFAIFYSFGGGTAAGFRCLLLERLLITIARRASSTSTFTRRDRRRPRSLKRPTVPLQRL